MPSASTVVIETSANCSPPSSRMASTTAVAVSVAPGHTWRTKRTPYFVTRPTSNQSVTTRPVMPMVSMPWAKMPG